MTIGTDLEFSHLLRRKSRGQDLASIIVEVDLVEHNLASLLLVRQLHEEGAVIRLHRLVLLNARVVWFPVLILGIASVKHTTDGTKRSSVIVQFGVSQIFWHPAPVDNNSLLFVLAIQVRVEGSDNIGTRFSVAHLFDLHLTRMVKEALNNDRLHGPIALELIKLVRLF